MKQNASGRYDVHLAAPFSPETRAVYSDLGISLIPWGGGRKPKVWAHDVRELRSKVRSLQPDVVHLHSTFAGLAGRIPPRAISARVVYQPHGWGFHNVGRLGAVAVASWEGWAARRRTDTIVNTSFSERAEGEARGIFARSVTVPNPLILPPAITELSRYGARELLGISQERPVVVSVGRICHQKGSDLMEHVWRAVRSHIPEAQCYLVGRISEARLGHIANLSDHGLVVTGWTSMPQVWIRAADLVVFTSRWEGLSLALLESMGCERSVVATVEGSPYDLEALGAGSRFAFGDVPAATSAIVERLNGRVDSDKEGLAGRDYVIEQNSIDDWWHRMDHIYGDPGDPADV